MISHPILVVEDDESQRRIIEYNLKQQGYFVIAVDSAEKAYTALDETEFFLLISDMKLPGQNGLELLREVRVRWPELPVIFITAFGTVEKAVEAMKEGAFDYITKPFDRDEFLLTVQRALEFQRLKEENQKLRRELVGRGAFSEIVGVSKAMQEMFDTITRVAPTDATVLLTGESGTGKELIARAIHQTSDRSAKSMITVNCAAIPRDLLESELFGHVSGAFTGAVKDKIGKFVLADGGTIFLDEIGDLDMGLQAKLLRVIQEKSVEPVGSNRLIAVDIRVIAATNRDLQAGVGNGTFREDLYYRLNVIPLHIKPLRERPEDIPALVDFFLKKQMPDTEITVERRALELLKAYPWPGNIRELENVIKRIVIFKEDRRIRVADLPLEIVKKSQAVELTENNHSILSESEIKLITEALKSSGWNQSRAAARLGIPRHVLIYRMKKYNIREE